MKAIHNAYLYIVDGIKTVFNTSKLQNESNSQLDAPAGTLITNCVQYVKITK